MIIDRRNAMAGVITMFGAGLFAPLARAYEAGVPVIGQTGGLGLTVAQKAALAPLTERILPTTDTPGALAAGVPAYIAQLLAEWALPADLTLIAGGLDAMDARAIKEYGKRVSRIGARQQDALLTLAMNGEVTGSPAFFEALRQMVIVGYYTSEIGITVEREYLPVPGRYDGAYPYKQGQKVFAS